MSDRDFEAEAREDGWVPQTEWAGDPNRWVPAEEFVKRGENIRPILQANNRRLKEQVDSLNARVDQLMDSNKRFAEMTDRQIKKERQEKEAVIKELEAVRAKAVTDGDGAAFDQADRKINELRSQKTEEQNQPPPNPAFVKWLDENPWYDDKSPKFDKVLTALVDGFSDQVRREKPWLIGIDHLNACRDEARKVMPDKFENPNRDRETVEGHQQAPKKSGGRTFNDLPQDAKDACKQFIRDIPGFTEEQYLDTYEWE